MDDGFGVQTGGPCVPQRQWSDPIGVDVLGRALQLGEGRDGAAGVVGAGAGHLQEDRLVGLDDEGAVGGCRGRHGRQYPKARAVGAVILATPGPRYRRTAPRHEPSVSGQGGATALILS